MKKIVKSSIYGLGIILPNILISLSAFAWGGGVQGGANQARTSDMPTVIFGNSGIFTQIVSVMMFLVGILSVIMLVFGGLRYVISRGDSKAVESAKNTILYAIVGLIVAILAYAIVNFVIGSFVGTSGGFSNNGSNGIAPTNV